MSPRTGQKKPAKQPRRSHQTNHGEGVFYHRASDDRWVGALEVGDNALGNRKRITVSDKDEDAAWDKFQAKRKVLLLEGRAAAKTRTKTTGAWLKEWLEAEQLRVRPKTFKGTRTYVTRWMIPTVGRVQLEDLEAKHAKAIIKAMLDAGKSTTYAGTVLGQFQSALRAAVAEGYRVPDAPRLVRKPAKAIHDRRDLSIDEALLVVKHLGKLVDEDPRASGYASRWLAAFLAGMRQGEALGMEWDRVHFDGVPRFDISWQLQQLPYKTQYDRTSGFAVPHGHKSRQIWGSWHHVELKSESGYRLAPMINVLMEMLKIWKEYCPPNDGNLVWPRDNGMPKDVAEDRKEWRELQETLGIWKTPPETINGQQVGGQHFVVHEIRHTTASILRHMKVDAKTIRDILGHADVSTTEMYQHVSLELAQEAMQALGRQLQLVADTPAVEIIPAPTNTATVDELLSAFAALDPTDRSMFLARAAVLLANPT
ncbi:tyrosine-type recombinase/integrase [Timonella senegalensis]|uniref:tyrosine-type recombinase/integrase n=1 Tax=Timonella senegalensis TaxID=1465825 RepID=UPI0028A5A20B|nr:site-specific integrase [Timonella senegalensis]